MKVNGQLEGAQLEQLSSGTATPASTARMFADVRNPLAAVPMFYNGSAWRPLALEQSSAFVSQNSGIACTVNWANGLNQEVVLTSHALISFSNPQPGKIHTLIVKQTNTISAGIPPNLWSYKFNMIDQDSQFQSYQPNIMQGPGQNRVYRWMYNTNIRPGYGNFATNTFIATTTPATLMTGLDISPDGKFFTGGRTSTPFLTQGGLRDPKYINNMLESPFQEFGTTAAPTAIAGQPTDICYHPSGKIVFGSMTASPYVFAGGLNQGTGDYLSGGIVAGLYGSPGTGVAGAGRSVAVSPNGLCVAVGHATTPFLSVYQWTARQFGSKFTNPGTLPAAQVNGVDFHPTADIIAAASQTFPYLEAWEFTHSAGPSAAFGAKIPNPPNAAAGGPNGGTGKCLKWRPQGDYIAMAMSVTPYIYVVPYDRATKTFGNAIAVGLGLPGAVNCLEWSPDGQYLLLGCSSGAYLYCVDFSTGTLVSTVPFDGTSPGQQINAIRVDPTGTFVFLAMNGGNFLISYSMPQKSRNYLKLVEGS